jgi:outer membrane protein assembly factor BamE (lipoprotein component of BamABCDE complex)
MSAGIFAFKMTLLAATACAVLCAFAYFAGCDTGASMVRKQAVTRGHAVWVADTVGNTTFVWKEAE